MTPMILKPSQSEAEIEKTEVDVFGNILFCFSDHRNIVILVASI